jgi:hypothetical protein
VTRKCVTPGTAGVGSRACALWRESSWLPPLRHDVRRRSARTGGTPVSLLCAEEMPWQPIATRCGISPKTPPGAGERSIRSSPCLQPCPLDAVRSSALPDRTGTCWPLDHARTAALERDLTELLADRQPWTWLAERGGAAVGMLAAERPDRAAWIAPMTRSTPAAYLLLGSVRAGQRGSEVGAALTARLHAQARAAGVACFCTMHRSIPCPRRSGASRGTGRRGRAGRPGPRTASADRAGARPASPRAGAALR